MQRKEAAVLLNKLSRSKCSRRIREERTSRKALPSMAAAGRRGTEHF